MIKMLDPEQLDTSSHEATDPAIEINNLLSHLPELAGQESAVLKTALELDNQFQLKPEFYQDRLRNFFFVAIAQRLTQARQSDHLSPQQKIQEEYFIHMALPMLAMDKSAKYAGLKDSIKNEKELPNTEKETIYEKYTNTALTAELDKAIQDGLLADVQQRLGNVLPSQPYELKVLAIGDIYAVSGMAPRRPVAEWSYPPSSEWQQYDVQYAEHNKYLAHLSDNAQSFIQEMGLSNAAIPLAWVEHIGDKKVLCVPEPVAEKILRPDRYYQRDFDAGQQKRDLAVLEHEFVHTQNSLLIEGETFYGIALEERRAEHFSQDQLGYQDVKGFFIDLEVASGFNAVEWLEQNKERDRADAFIALANELGVQATLEIALAVPKPYLKDSRTYQQKIAEYIGGSDEFLQRMYRHAEATQPVELEDRINARVRIWADRGLNFELLRDIRGGNLGLNFMTDKYYEASQRLTEKQI